MGKLTGRAEPTDRNKLCNSALRPPRGALPVLWSDSSSSEAEVPTPSGAPLPACRSQQQQPRPQGGIVPAFERASVPHPATQRRATSPSPLGPADLVACTASAARRLTQQLTEQGGWRAAAEALAACTPPPAALLPTPHLSPRFTPTAPISTLVEYTMRDSEGAADTTNIDDLLDGVSLCISQHSAQPGRYQSGAARGPLKATPQPTAVDARPSSARMHQWSGQQEVHAPAQQTNFVALKHTPMARTNSTMTGSTVGVAGRSPASVLQPAAVSRVAMPQHTAAAAGQTMAVDTGRDMKAGGHVLQAPALQQTGPETAATQAPAMVLQLSPGSVPNSPGSRCIRASHLLHSPASTSSSQSISSRQRPGVSTPVAGSAVQQDLTVTPAGLPSAPAPTTPATWQSDWQSSLRGGPNAGSPQFQRTAAAPSSHGRSSVSFQQGSHKGLKRPSTVQSSAALENQGTEVQTGGAMQGRSAGRHSQPSRKQTWGLRGSGRESGAEQIGARSPALSVGQSSPARILNWGTAAGEGSPTPMPELYSKQGQKQAHTPQQEGGTPDMARTGVTPMSIAVPRISEGGMEVCETTPRSAGASCGPGRASDDDLTSPESFTYGSRMYAFKQGPSFCQSQPTPEPQFVAGGGSCSSIRSSSRYSLRRQHRVALSLGNGLEGIAGSSSSPSPSRVTGHTATASVFTNPVFHTRQDVLLAGSPAEVKSTAAASRPAFAYVPEIASRLQHGPGVGSPMPPAWDLPLETPRALINSLLGGSTLEQASNSGQASVNHSGRRSHSSKHSGSKSSHSRRSNAGARQAQFRSSDDMVQNELCDSQGSCGARLQGPQQQDGNFAGILPGGMITPMLDKVDAAVSRYRRRLRAARHHGPANRHAQHNMLVAGVRNADDSWAVGSASEGSNSGDSYCTATPMNTLQRRGCMAAAGAPEGTVGASDAAVISVENHPIPPLIIDGNGEPVSLRGNRSSFSPKAWQTRSTPTRLPADAEPMQAGARSGGSSAGSPDLGELQYSVRHSMHSTDVTHLIRSLQHARQDSTSPRSSIRRLCHMQDCSYQSTAHCGPQLDPALMDDATSAAQPMLAHRSVPSTAREVEHAGGTGSHPTDNGSSWMSSPVSGQLRAVRYTSSASNSAQCNLTMQAHAEHAPAHVLPGFLNGTDGHIQPASPTHCTIEQGTVPFDDKTVAGMLLSGTQPSISDVDQLDQCVNRGTGPMVSSHDSAAAQSIDGIAVVQAGGGDQNQQQQVCEPGKSLQGVSCTAQPAVQQAPSVAGVPESMLPMFLGASLMADVFGVLAAPSLDAEAVLDVLPVSTRSSGVVGDSSCSELQTNFQLPSEPVLPLDGDQPAHDPSARLQPAPASTVSADGDTSQRQQQQHVQLQNSLQQTGQQQEPEVQASPAALADASEQHAASTAFVRFKPAEQAQHIQASSRTALGSASAALTTAAISSSNGPEQPRKDTSVFGKRRAAKRHEGSTKPVSAAPSTSHSSGVCMWRAACSTVVTAGKALACLLMALLFGAGLLALQRHGASLLPSSMSPHFKGPAPTTPAAQLGVHPNILNTTPAAPAATAAQPVKAPTGGMAPTCPMYTVQLALVHAVGDPWSQLPSTCIEGVNMAYLAGSISRQMQQMRHSLRRARAVVAAEAAAAAARSIRPEPAETMQAKSHRPAAVMAAAQTTQSMHVGMEGGYAAVERGNSKGAGRVVKAHVQVPFTHLHPAPPYRPPMRQLFSTYISHAEILVHVQWEQQQQQLSYERSTARKMSLGDIAGGDAPAPVASLLTAVLDNTQYDAHMQPYDELRSDLPSAIRMQEEQLHDPDLPGRMQPEGGVQQQQYLPPSASSGKHAAGTMNGVDESNLNATSSGPTLTAAIPQESVVSAVTVTPRQQSGANAVAAAVPQGSALGQQQRNVVALALRVLLLAGLLGGIMAGVMLLASYIVSDGPVQPATTAQAMMAAAANVPVMLAAAACCVAAAAGHAMRAGAFALQQAFDGLSERLGHPRPPVPFYMQSRTQLVPAGKHMSRALWHRSYDVTGRGLQSTHALATSLSMRARLQLQHALTLLRSTRSSSLASSDGQDSAAASLDADQQAGTVGPVDDWQADRALLGLSPLTGRVLRLKGEGLMHTPGKEQEGGVTPADANTEAPSSPAATNRHNRSHRKTPATTPAATPNTRVTRATAAAAAAAAAATTAGDTQRRNKQSRARLTPQQQQQGMDRDALLQAAAAGHAGASPSVQHVWLRNRVVLRQMVEDD